MSRQLLLKIRMGTRSDNDKRLCDSCSWGMVMKGSRESEEAVHCTWMEKYVTLRVTECTRYSSTEQPALRELEQIACVLNVNGRSKSLNVGFVKPDED